MPAAITPELYWLILTTLMTALLWPPYIANRLAEIGVPSFGWNPPLDPEPRALWAARAKKAHANAVENLVVFAPLALAVHATGAGTALTANASMVYFSRGRRITSSACSAFPYRFGPWRSWRDLRRR